MEKEFKRRENIVKLNELFLEVKSHIGSLETEEDLLDYKEKKSDIISRMNAIECIGSEDDAVKDKINIYYRFCENKVIPGIHKGKEYRFIR